MLNILNFRIFNKIFIIKLFIFIIIIIHNICNNIGIAKSITDYSSNSNLNNSSDIRIVTTIKPFYNLVSAVTRGVDNCKLILLLQGNVSPHDYALKLKDVKLLYKADLIIWGGEQLEFFLSKLLEQPKFQNKLITIQKESKLKILNFRNSKYLDEHLWLSPYNAKVIVMLIERHLITIDPNNAKKYATNRKKFLIKLANTDNYIKNNLLLNKHKTYLVFHDAYQYFENFYGLQPPIVISDNPAMPLSVKRMFHIHDIMLKNQVNCLFKEPQFNAKILDSLIQSPNLNQNLKIGILDPLGKDEDMGPDGYIRLLINLSESFKSCFN